MADTTERLLALLSTLQGGRPYTGSQLAERLGVSARTVRRDVERLRTYGYAIDARPGPGGRYRLAAGHALPPLVLDDGEAVATMLGLAVLSGPAAAPTTVDESETVANAASRAYGKIDQVLPARLRPQLHALRASTEPGRDDGPGVATAVVAVLSEAIEHRRVIRFDYHDQHAAPSERRVEPYRQIHLRARWYLLAWDLDRNDWRVFRLDRISGLTRTTVGFTARPLPAESATDYLLQGMHARVQHVRLSIDAPATAVIDAFKEHGPEVEPVEDGSCLVDLWLDRWEWLVLPLARLDGDVTVLEPDDVRTALRTFAQRLGAATSPSHGGGAAPPRRG